jgi:multidrug efflux pump subunit AcrA (membrane-fusion protein)
MIMSNRAISVVIGAVLLAAIVLAAIFLRHAWLPYFSDTDDEPEEPGASMAAAEVQQAKLSPEARKNLDLVAKPLQPQTYWRTVLVPGTITDRPGISDRSVPAPVTGVVVKVHRFPGDVVKPGDPLVTLKITGESLHLSQTELFKNSTERAIAEIEHKRYSDPDLKKLNQARFIELEYQLKRFGAAVSAYRQDLQARGLTREQIDDIASGKFVTEIQVTVPPEIDRPPGLPPVNKNAPEPLEIHDLKVELGQQVQAGQTLCFLANHRWLYIEGHTFKRETIWLEQTVRNGWPIQVEFAEDEANGWPPLEGPHTIRHLSNTVDPDSRTLTFYVSLTNQSRTYEKDGRKLLVWRFRPGQRVHMRVPVQELKNVFVLPVGAVVREGPEAYIFRQNGDLFERRPVHVLYEDRQNVVIANDGAIRPGVDYVAQGAAASLQRVLKAQNASGGLPPGAHFHADGSLHIPGK